MTIAKSNSLGRSPLHLLHRVAQCVGELFEREFGDSDVTPRQLAVIMTVAENKGLSQTKIVDRTGIDRSTLSDIVRRLQKKGLVQRRRTKEDARAYAVDLTDKGRNLLRKATPLVEKVDERIVKALGKGREEFIDRMATIVANVERDAKAMNKARTV